MQQCGVWSLYCAGHSQRRLVTGAYQQVGGQACQQDPFAGPSDSEAAASRTNQCKLGCLCGTGHQTDARCLKEPDVVCLQGPISKWADRRANQDPFAGPSDSEAAAQAHINAVSGACLALGIKYAGTASQAAVDLLHRYVMYLLTSKQAAPDPVSGKSLLPSRPKVVMVAHVGACLALSIRYAGMASQAAADLCTATSCTC